LLDTVSFDASATTDEGIRCLDLCTYSWEFGGEAMRTGRIVTYAFQSVRSYAVTLTVTDVGGAVHARTKNLAVSQGTAPTARILFSPSSPAIYETVNFTGEASTAGQAGRTIVNHQWQFGDGTSATGLRVTKTYERTGTYTVVLTVTDSAGLQGTERQDVTVVAGVTADFTISPTGPVVSQTVVLNAEASKGSNGFGGRNPITKYIWSFGNSTSTTEESDPITSTSYSVAGTYTIVLTVEDSAGRRATTSKTVAVTVP
jgi:PKD repeat protein